VKKASHGSPFSLLQGFHNCINLTLAFLCTKIGALKEDVVVPRPKSVSHSNLTPGQALYVLGRLISDRRVSRTDVSRYIGDMQGEISDLERRLNELRAAAGAAAAAVTGAPVKRRGRPAGVAAAAPAARKATRKRSAITAEQLESRKLQGRYLGLVRQVPAARRAAFKKVVKERGREAAIEELLKFLKKK
jgi:hypothetical protein